MKVRRKRDFSTLGPNEPSGYVELIEDAELDELSIVDRPATDKPFQYFKAQGGAMQTKGPFDDCVESVLADPDFKPQEGKTREESAQAICAAKHEEKEVKDETGLVGDPAPGGVETIDIPATPTEWSLDSCLAEARDLGFSETTAIDVCSAVTKSFGDPRDPRQILLPDGTETASVLIAAAQKIAAPLPADLSPELIEEAKGIKLSTKNYWGGWFSKLLNLGRSPKPEAKVVQRLEGRVSEMADAMKKTNDDLRSWIEQQGRMQMHLIHLLAQERGITLPPLDSALFSSPAPGAANPVTEANSPAAPVPGAAPGAAGSTTPSVAAPAPELAEAAKCGPAPTGGDAVKALEAKVDRLLEALAPLLGQNGGSGVLAPTAQVPGAVTDPSLPPATADAVPTGDPALLDPIDQLALQEAILPPGMKLVPGGLGGGLGGPVTPAPLAPRPLAATPAQPAQLAAAHWQKSVDPTVAAQQGKASTELEWSTVCGAYIPKADREAQREVGYGRLAGLARR